MTSSHSSSLMLKIIRSLRMPATLTTISSLPNSLIATLTTPSPPLTVAMSIRLATATPPAALISFTTSSAGVVGSSLPSTVTPRSLTTTAAPLAANALATARPIPRPLPVTTAALPSRIPIPDLLVRRLFQRLSLSRRARLLGSEQPLIQSIQFRGRITYDLAPVPLRDLAQVFGHVVLRTRKRCLPMRIIRRPHDVVRWVPVEQIYEHRIIDEGRIDLSLDVLAGLERQLETARSVFVYAKQVEGNPGHVVLGRYDFQARKSLEHLAEHHRGQRTLDRMDHRDESRHKFDAAHLGVDHLACVPGGPLGAGQNVQRERHVEVLRCCPKRIVVRH